MRLFSPSHFGSASKCWVRVLAGDGTGSAAPRATRTTAREPATIRPARGAARVGLIAAIFGDRCRPSRRLGPTTPELGSGILRKGFAHRGSGRMTGRQRILSWAILAGTIAGGGLGATARGADEPASASDEGLKLFESTIR